MDDRRLGFAELARLCLDAAQKDGFARSAKFVRDRISMGAFLYKSVNAELKRLGYLARQQAQHGWREGSAAWAASYCNYSGARPRRRRFPEGSELLSTFIARHHPRL